MSTYSPDPSETEQCVLKCENVERLLPFPDEKIFRDLWLYKLGLNSYDESFRVCNQHFSETMLSSGELIELAVPDINVPNSPIMRNRFYEKLLNILIQPPALSEKQKEKLLKRKAAGDKEKLDSLKTLLIMEAAKETNSKLSKNMQKKNFPPKNMSSENVSSMTRLQSNQQVKKSWLNDTSTLLMDYQLRVQGRHVCDVVELPEYVVVFTIVKPKIKPTTQDALVQKNSKENMNPLPTIPSTADLYPMEANEINTDYDELISERVQTPEIDYVYYSLTEDSVPTREREVQVEIGNNTCETGTQCDIELENDMLQMATYVHRITTHSPILQVGMHECHTCGEILPNYSAKIRHESGHKKRTSLCPRCGEVFSNPIKLKAHESDAHLGSELDIRKALRCPKLKCNKAFHSRKQLNNHIDDHMRHVSHKCIKCRRLFNSALKLNRHLKTFKECLKYCRSKTRRWSRRK